MNQSLIINDDYIYNKDKLCWSCSAMLSGNLISIYIVSKVAEDELDQSIKFDWECIIEEWLEENEPDINNNITITAD